MTDFDVHELLPTNAELKLFELEQQLLSEPIPANNKELDPYRFRMELQETYFEMIRPYVSDYQLERISNCSTWFQFDVDKTFSHKKVKRANRCGMKMCPQCARAASLKRSIESATIMSYLSKEGYDFIFLTLTCKNVWGEKLKGTITDMNQAFNKFLKYKDIKERFHGTIRKFELTYNPYVYKSGKLVRDKNGNPIIDPAKPPFNPHLHIIVAVKKSYFKKNYLTQKKYKELWQKALKVEYLPSVNVQKVKPREFNDKQEYLERHANDFEKDVLSNKRLVDGAFEISKYMAKSSDYLKSSELFETFYQTTFKRRSWTFTGICTDVRKKYKKQELKNIFGEAEILDFCYHVEYNFSTVSQDFYMTKWKIKE